MDLDLYHRPTTSEKEKIGVNRILRVGVSFRGTRKIMVEILGRPPNELTLFWQMALAVPS